MLKLSAKIPDQKIRIEITLWKTPQLYKNSMHLSTKYQALLIFS
jgi:hypothetical protein